jgi:hypothetical protein
LNLIVKSDITTVEIVVKSTITNGGEPMTLELLIMGALVALAFGTFFAQAKVPDYWGRKILHEVHLFVLAFTWIFGLATLTNPSVQRHWMYVLIPAVVTALVYGLRKLVKPKSLRNELSER